LKRDNERLRKNGKRGRPESREELRSMRKSRTRVGNALKRARYKPRDEPRYKSRTSCLKFDRSHGWDYKLFVLCGERAREKKKGRDQRESILATKIKNTPYFRPRGERSMRKLNFYFGRIRGKEGGEYKRKGGNGKKVQLRRLRRGGMSHSHR